MKHNGFTTFTVKNCNLSIVQTFVQKKIMYFCRRNMFDQNDQLLIYFSNRSIFNGKLK